MINLEESLGRWPRLLHLAPSALSFSRPFHGLGFVKSGDPTDESVGYDRVPTRASRVGWVTFVRCADSKTSGDSNTIDRVLKKDKPTPDRNRKERGNGKDSIRLLSQMLLLPNGICFANPRRKFIIEVRKRVDTKRVQVVSRREGFDA
ncbi:MAG TPA: hypothetical protein VFZ40_10680 [Pyrinomonadaceae bacterium]